MAKHLFRRQPLIEPKEALQMISILNQDEPFYDNTKNRKESVDKLFNTFANSSSGLSATAGFGAFDENKSSNFEMQIQKLSLDKTQSENVLGSRIYTQKLNEINLTKINTEDSVSVA